MAEIEALVVPNSSRFSVEVVSDSSKKRLKIKLDERAEKGKGNAVLVKKLSKFLGADVVIVRGHTAKRKLLAIGLSEEELSAKLNAL